jgi:hypothetical protein
MDTVEIVKMIKTTLTRRGKGVEGDPVRVITQYWDFEGNLLIEIDRHREVEPITSPNITRL